MLRQATFFLVAAVTLSAMPARAQDDGLDALQEKAIKTATRAVAPSVVQIETTGGKDVFVRDLDDPRKVRARNALGPTTGVVVGADGYIFSSAFNFANEPTSITVRVPGHKEGYIADVVATDKTRMLALLKIRTALEKPLAVPPTAPKAEIKIGQSAIALGRTLNPNPNDSPSVSVGIISATGRIWGRALQTDAKVGPTNYGGPLVDFQGRVQGILVPLSPQGEDEAAGLEGDDSGIGFAVPMEDFIHVLDRLKVDTANKPVALGRGQLGVEFPQNSNQFGSPPKIANILPGSAAEKAGIKVGDVLTEIDGKPIRNIAQVKHALGSKYDGDAIAVKVTRGNEEKIFAAIPLGGVLVVQNQATLGILPVRDDSENGVEVRYVYPKGPADTAGIKVGDRLTKIGLETGPMTPFYGPADLSVILGRLIPLSKVKLEVVRKDKKTETVTVTLGEWPSKGALDEVPEELPKEATKRKATEAHKAIPGLPPPPPPAKKEDKDKKAETGVVTRKNAAATHDYWMYVPRDYDPNVSYALVVWLHPAGKNKEKDDEDFQDDWIQFCRDNNIIVVGPHAEAKTGWAASESDVIVEIVKDVMATYNIDKHRVVAHGMEVGGQFAFYLGFHNRDVFRAVATTGATLTNQPKEKVRSQPLSFFLHVGGKDPVKDGVADTRTKLVDQKYPVVFYEEKDAGQQYLDEDALKALIRWIDSLDRL